MINFPNDEPAAAASPIGVAEMIELVKSLAVLIAEENAQLRSGVPATLVGTVQLKIKLASELERHVRVVRAGGLFDGDTDPRLRASLVQCNAELQMAMQENARHLRAAMLSTRRRVDAIMRAFREHETRPGQYDNAGRRTMSRDPSLGLGRTI
ncbi:MAG: hypothetical protein ACOH2N_04090 [Devosia sp.]